MGHTIWVEVHGRPLKDTADDSGIMHRLMDNLDALAGKLSVRKLSDFYDYSELEEAYGEFDEEGDADSDDSGGEEERDTEPSLEERQAKGEWFDSTEGLKAVRALRQHLSERFEDLGFTPDSSTDHWPKRLMDELRTSQAILEEAAAKGRRFRLLIVP
jgi:hypothetical protein